jgi:hypothetical protein
LTACPNIKAPTIARLLHYCRRLCVLKVELWYDQQPVYIQDRVRQIRSAHGGEHRGRMRRSEAFEGDAIDERTQRSYRLIDSIHSAVKSLQFLLPPDDPSLRALLSR